MFVSQCSRTIRIDNSISIGSGNLGGVYHWGFCRVAHFSFHLRRFALHFPYLDVCNARNTHLAAH